MQWWDRQLLVKYYYYCFYSYTIYRYRWRDLINTSLLKMCRRKTGDPRGKTCHKEQREEGH